MSLSDYQSILAASAELLMHLDLVIAEDGDMHTFDLSDIIRSRSKLRGLLAMANKDSVLPMSQPLRLLTIDQDDGENIAIVGIPHGMSPEQAKDIVANLDMAQEMEENLAGLRAHGFAIPSSYDVINV